MWGYLLGSDVLFNTIAKYFSGFKGAFITYAIFFAIFFHESYIAHIITVVGAQQKHKGMFLKDRRKGGGGDLLQ